MNRQQLETILGDRLSTLLLSVQVFETLPSTNQTLWQLIDQGAPIGTVVVARQQTAGRGQWGREWQSSLGGLYLSIALNVNLAAEDAAQLTMGSAWGIATAFRGLGIPVEIKWPNDLILMGKKLGGILTETRVQQGKIVKAVVGVGINWDNLVPETGINLQSFLATSDEKAIASLEMLAAVTLEGLISGYQYVAAEGIEDLLPLYLELLCIQNRPAMVNGKTGTIVGVTPTGELRVHWQNLDGIEAETCFPPGTISLGYDS